MEYVVPLLQAVVTTGVGACVGWMFCKRTINTRPISIFTRNVSDNVKMVLVVRNDLGMGKGKIAAQCSHAALGCYRYAVEDFPDYVDKWERNGEMKVVLKAPDYEVLKQLKIAAASKGLPHCLIHDAGRTQIPAGSATVLGIGPADAEAINELTGDLKLF